MASLFGQNIDFLDSAYAPRPIMPNIGGDSFFKGWQLRQQQQQQDLEKQKQDVMLPLQQKQAELQLQSASLDLVAKTEAANVRIKAKAGEAQLAQQMATIDYTNPQDRASIWKTVADYPDVAQLPVFKQIQENFVNSDKAAAAAAHYKQMSDEAEARIKLMELRQNLGTPTQQDAAAAMQLRQKAEQSRQAGDTTNYQEFTRQADLIESHLSPKGVQVQTGYDDQGRPIFTTNVGGGNATVGTQTAAQQKQIGYDIAIQGIGDVLKNLRPEDVGVRGVVGEMISDKYLAQIDPSFANQPRIEKRAALRALREQLIQSISAEPSGRFSNKDVQRIGELASGLEASTSLPELKTKFGELKYVLSSRSRTYAERMGLPVPDFTKTADEIKTEYSAKRAALQKAVEVDHTLTAEQANAESKAAYDKAKALLQKLGENQ